MSTLNSLIDRLVIMQREAVPNSHAMNVATDNYPRYPYWTNQAGPSSYENASAHQKKITYQITMRLFAGKLTEGQRGALESTIHDYIGDVFEYFAARPRLQCATAPSVLTNLDPNGFTSLTCPGITAMNDGADMGTLFVLTAAFDIEILPNF